MSPSQVQPDRAAPRPRWSASFHLTHQNVNLGRGKKHISWENDTKGGAVGESASVSEDALPDLSYFLLRGKSSVNNGHRFPGRPSGDLTNTDMMGRLRNTNIFLPI